MTKVPRSIIEENRGEVVWNGDDGTDHEIYFYDGNDVMQITNNNWDDRNPKIIYQGDLTWEMDDGDDEICFYDGDSVIQLTDNAENDRNPQINNSGEVVWQGYDGYDGDSIIQLTDQNRLLFSKPCLLISPWSFIWGVI